MSQKQQIRKFLDTGRQITPARAYSLCGSLRLSERIRELKADGYPIKKEWVKVGKNKMVMGYSRGMK
jgi:hypothetical protein